MRYDRWIGLDWVHTIGEWSGLVFGGMLLFGLVTFDLTCCVCAYSLAHPYE